MKNNHFVTEYKVFLLIELVSSLLLSLSTIVFAFDLSLLAFPLSLIYTGFFAFYAKKVLVEKNGMYASWVLKFIQYAPTVLFISFILRRGGKFDTSAWYDWATVLLWVINFIGCCWFQVRFDSKKIVRLEGFWNIEPPKPVKRHGISLVIFEAFDWIDNILQIIVFMLVIQIFTFQLYVIPSESMVPEFLIGDRVFVEKVTNGPVFPLTEVGLPTITKYKRGDIVVLRNPHYSMDRKSEFKSTVRILCSMLTFNLKNFNVDEKGAMKADPLVKRIAGISGEQLVMQDGVLYSRTKDSDVFKPVPSTEDYGAWNLNTQSKSLLSKVEYIPLSEKEYADMLDFEEERRNLDLGVAEMQAKLLVERFKNLSLEGNTRFTEPSLFMYDLYKNCFETAMNASSQKGGTDWFEKFMTGWISSKNAERDMYAESNYRLDIMSKLIYGEIVVRTVELSKVSGFTADMYNSDQVIADCYVRANKVFWYVQELLDLRNMPVFPACTSDGKPNYIPQNCYFMMGDNRFNSLDLRHRMDQKLESLTKDDPYSVTYYSQMEPQYLNQKYIVGKPVYRIWPVSRRGSLNK